MIVNHLMEKYPTVDAQLFLGKLISEVGQKRLMTDKSSMCTKSFSIYVC